MTSVWIPGEPVAKGRPRMTAFAGRARAYTPAATRLAEERVATAWTHPMIAAGVPVYVRIVAYMQRPAGHFRKDGSLSAAGLRVPVPVKRPDLDNVLKLVLDALNGVAFHDDAQLARVRADRWWAEVGIAGRGAGVYVEVNPLEGVAL